MSEISLIDGTLILNGVEITGFGDSESAIEFPTVDIAAIRRGADGRTISGKTGNFGGPMNLVLLQNSRGFQFLMTIRQAQQAGAGVRFDGFYRHELAGIDVSMSNGILLSAPNGPTLGNGAPPAITFSIEFGTIQANYAVANVE